MCIYLYDIYAHTCEHIYTIIFIYADDNILPSADEAKRLVAELPDCTKVCVLECLCLCARVCLCALCFYVYIYTYI